MKDANTEAQSSREPDRAVRRKRRWRRARRACIALLLLALLLFVGFTQTPVLRWIVLSQVSAKLNCGASCTRVAMTYSGDVIIEGLQLRAKGVDGPAQNFLDVPDVLVDVDWSGMIFGPSMIEHVVFRSPVLRISVDDELTTNIASLQQQGGGGKMRLPEIEIVDGLLEAGEHGPGWYAPLASLPVSGEVLARPGARRVYDVRLEELARPGGANLRDDGRTMRLTGELDLEDISGRLELVHVDLGEWSLRKAPAVIEQLWRDLDLRGDISRATLEFEKGDVRSEFMLDRVDLNLPMARDDSGDIVAIREGGEQLLAMRDVVGPISFSNKGVRARLSGQVEDLACEVSFEMKDLDELAAIDCTIRAEHFRVAERPQLLPFAPSFVRTLFQRFSSPTAEVSGIVNIRRDPPAGSVAAPFIVSGALELRSGTAMYETFAYPISGLRGTILFDDQSVELVRLQGRGPEIELPDGSKLAASILIDGEIGAPFGTGPIDLNLTVVDIPIEQSLTSAIPEAQRGIFTTLFNTESYEELVALELIISSEMERALQLERERLLEDPASAAAGEVLAEIERKLAIPVFDLAGVAAISARVHREAGPEREFEIQSTINMPAAGILVPQFPYPVTARDVRIVVDDGEARIQDAELRGFGGGSGVIGGKVLLGDAGNPPSPLVEIRATGVAVDDYLIHAVPGPDLDELEAELESGRRRFSAKRLLRRLGLDGEVDCDALIHRDEAGRLAFDINIVAEDVDARPEYAPATLHEVDADILITRRNMAIRSMSGRMGQSPFDLAFSADYGDRESNTPAQWTLGFDSEHIDLGFRFEELIELIAPGHTTSLHELREQADPQGRARMRIDAHGSSDGMAFLARLSEFDAFGLQIDDAGIELRDAVGEIVLTERTLIAENFRADVFVDGAPSGRVQIDGTFGEESADEPATLALGIQDGRFESPFLDMLLRSFDAEIAERYQSLLAVGNFAADVVVKRDAEGRILADGWIEPTRLEMTRRGERITFDRIVGRIGFSPEGGRFENVRAETPNWTIQTHGNWYTNPAAGLDVQLEIDGQDIGNDLRALLPEALDGALRAIQLDLEVSGAFTLRKGRLMLGAVPGRSIEEGNRFRAEVDVSGLRLRPGVQVDRLNGRAVIDVRRSPAEAQPRIDLAAHADSFELAGISMTNGRMRLVSGDDPGTYLLPLVQADVHGGVMTVRGSVARSSALARPPDLEYEFHAELAGVDFDDVIRDFDKAPSREDRNEPAERGILEGGFSIRGLASDPATRRGRGLLRVQGGRILNLPGVIALLRLSNLQLPVGEQLGFAFADFFIDGETVFLPRIEVAPQDSDSFVILGDGSMTWPEMDLSLSFTMRGGQRLPWLSDALDVFRDELITAVVTGPLNEPNIRAEQFTGTRRMLETIFQGDAGSNQRRTVAPAQSE